MVVTHGLATVETMCDRAAWLDHGVLQMEGDAAEVAAAYLQRVNAKEAEVERVAAEAEAAAAPSSTQTATPPSPMAPQRRGHPDRERRVRRTRRQRRATSAIYRDPFTIRIHYDAVRARHQPGVRHRHPHVDDGPRHRAPTRRSTTPTSARSTGAGHVDFSVDSLPLTPGDYEITVAISDEFIQHNYDRHEREYHLRVRSGTDSQTPEGVIDMRGQWATASTADVDDPHIRGAR